MTMNNKVSLSGIVTLLPANANRHAALPDRFSLFIYRITRFTLIGIPMA